MPEPLTGIGGGESGSAGSPEFSSPASHARPLGRNGVPSADTLATRLLIQPRKAAKGSENMSAPTVGQSACNPGRLPFNPSTADAASPCGPAHANNAREKSSRNKVSRSPREMPSDGKGLAMSKAAGGGKTSEATWTVVAPALTVIFCTDARMFIDAPGDQSINTPRESAEMEMPAVTGRAGTGCRRKEACCPAIRETLAAPDSGRSNASSSACHEKFHGGEAAEARSPIRNCCGSAGLPDVC